MTLRAASTLTPAACRTRFASEPSQASRPSKRFSVPITWFGCRRASRAAWRTAFSFGREAGLRGRGRAWRFAQEAFDLSTQRLGHLEPLKHLDGHALAVAQDAHEQMFGLDALVPTAARLLGRQDDCPSRTGSESLQHASGPGSESLHHSDLPRSSHHSLARSTRILQPG